MAIRPRHTGSLVTTWVADDPTASYHVDQEITKSHEANNRFPHLLLPPPQSTAQER